MKEFFTKLLPKEITIESRRGYPDSIKARDENDLNIISSCLDKIESDFARYKAQFYDQPIRKRRKACLPSQKNLYVGRREHVIYTYSQTLINILSLCINDLSGLKEENFGAISFPAAAKANLLNGSPLFTEIKLVLLEKLSDICYLKAGGSKGHCLIFFTPEGRDILLRRLFNLKGLLEKNDYQAFMEVNSSRAIRPSFPILDSVRGESVQQEEAISTESGYSSEVIGDNSQEFLADIEKIISTETKWDASFWAELYLPNCSMSSDNEVENNNEDDLASDILYNCSTL